MELSNYPPGVTGMEPQIAGPQMEHALTRTCEAEDVAIWVLTQEGHTELQHHAELMADVWAHVTPTTLATLDRQARRIEAMAVSFDVEQCPFEGVVDVASEWSHGILTETWTCPLCHTDHQTELDRHDLEG